MKAQKQLAIDLKIKKEMAKRVIADVAAIIEDISSKEELAERVIVVTPSAYAEYIVLHGVVNLAEENGLHRGGIAIMDSIMDSQWRKIRQYGNKSYRLSKKQVDVIITNCWLYIK